MNSLALAFLPSPSAVPARAGLPSRANATPRRERHPVLLAVVLVLHGLGLYALSRQRPPEPVPTPPTIQVALLPPTIEPPRLEPEPPRPQPPKPQPAPPRKTPTVTPKPVVTPTPVAQQPEPTTTAPTALSAPPAPPPEPNPTPVKAAPTEPEPIVEARYDAAYLNNETPYPALARRMGETGTVRLRVLVSAEGRAQEIELVASSGSPRLDTGAREAVRNWRFIPAKQGNKPIQQWLVVPIVYKFKES